MVNWYDLREIFSEAAIMGLNCGSDDFDQPLELSDQGKLEPRTPGAWEGRVWIADDFDDESEEINFMFYGKQ